MALGMERRTAKVNFSNAGGTAAKGSKTCKVTLPTSWVGKIGVTETNREVDIFFNNDEIIIKHKLEGTDFSEQKIKKNHDMKIYLYYDENILCTTIYVDFTDKTLVLENHVTNPVKTAFGNNTNPTWSEFMTFLEDRCVPRGRDGLREYLETLGLDEYSPLDLINITSGRIAGDNQWLTSVDLNK